jgi:hypothetical protein
MGKTPAFKTCASLAAPAARSCRGSTPTSLFSFSQPFAQEVSLAGYLQCHHTKKS